MSRAHLWMPLLLQLATPALLLGWLAFGRHGGLAAWLLTATAVGGWLLAAAVAGLWLALPWLVAPVYLLLFAAALARSFRAMRTAPRRPMSLRRRVALAVRGALALASTALALHALSGRRPPSGPAVDLSFPLTAGTYYIANGGSVELLNAHVATLDADGAAGSFRGQSHGIDILAIDRRGLRASGIAPGDPAAYAIFGATVVAPCDGTVRIAADGLPDLSPPRVDREHLAGNHVVLGCGELLIVLGHLRRGSVCVSAGDVVRAGDPLGQVGNSGNSAEPHLHIHAQRPGDAGRPFAGDPIPIRFEGHYLARNAIVVRDR